jgi:hypothetical protein
MLNKRGRLACPVLKNTQAPAAPLIYAACLVVSIFSKGKGNAGDWTRSTEAEPHSGLTASHHVRCETSAHLRKPLLAPETTVSRKRCIGIRIHPS